MLITVLPFQWLSGAHYCGYHKVVTFFGCHHNGSSANRWLLVELVTLLTLRLLIAWLIGTQFMLLVTFGNQSNTIFRSKLLCCTISWYFLDDHDSRVIVKEKRKSVSETRDRRIPIHKLF